MCSVDQILHLGKSATKTLEIICIPFGNKALKRTTVFEWYSYFNVNCHSLEIDERSMQPSTRKTGEMWEK